jgi:hypothetical protein
MRAGRSEECQRLRSGLEVHEVSPYQSQDASHIVLKVDAKKTVVEDGNAQAVPLKVANTVIQLDTGRPAQKQRTAKLHPQQAPK